MPATFDDAAWRANPEAVRDALEANRIVYFPACPLPLPPAATLDFLRRELPSRLKLKNISYHPEAGKVSGLEADEETTLRVTETLRSHLDEVQGFPAARHRRPDRRRAQSEPAASARSRRRAAT